ncbi:DUF5020 family protein [uncultured Bacteroides sp.]|uniref:nucleoside-specific channel-forming Tsx family protein n=1 Tax=uncultured Bacteroides sp. TaxID=162156 RepID=UPI002AAADDA7|nr:DUF5020 family protein [uncultured Bacteroides sp.]
MKRITTTFLLVLLVATTFVEAQNIQLHYDLGRSLYNKDLKGRPLLTSTVEDFHPDKWGSTFFFVDMDYTSEGVASAYWEIVRELKFWKGPFSAHVEYNGGLAKGFSYNNAYLLGPTYTYNNASFTKGFTLTAMYKYIQKHSSPNNFQLTGTWYTHFNKGKFSFCGFADWWREETQHGKTIFLSEPQFWVNLNKFKGVDEKFNLSFGSEVELSNNFGGRDGFYVIPTLALKWTLN